MKRILTYRANGSNSLTLGDLRRILDDAEKLNVYSWATPKVRVLKPSSSRGSASGTIREITMEGDR